MKNELKLYFHDVDELLDFISNKADKVWKYALMRNFSITIYVNLKPRDSS